MSCDYFKNNICRSCSLMELSAAQQLEEKRRLVREALEERGIFSPVSDCIGSDSAFSSRNKAKLAVGPGTLGIPKDTFFVSDISACPLLIRRPSSITSILASIKEIVLPQVLPYSIKNRSGELKYCIIRASESTGEVFVRFVVRSKAPEETFKLLARELIALHPEIEVISLNIQAEHKAILEGPEEVYLTEQRCIVDRVDEYSFYLSPQSFSQVTTNVAIKLYRLVAEAAKAAQPNSALDLYCGVGTFGTFISKYSRSVTGVEIVADAIQDAKRSAELNGIKNISFTALDVDAWLEQGGLNCHDFVVVNPPRRGLSEKLISALCQAAPKTLVYSSCNPQTLARDLLALTKRFEIHSIQPLDMFPMQPHVETLVSMRRFKN